MPSRPKHKPASKKLEFEAGIRSWKQRQVLNAVQGIFPAGPKQLELDIGDEKRKKSERPKQRKEIPLKLLDEARRVLKIVLKQNELCMKETEGEIQIIESTLPVEYPAFGGTDRARVFVTLYAGNPERLPKDLYYNKKEQEEFREKLAKNCGLDVEFSETRIRIKLFDDNEVDELYGHHHDGSWQRLSNKK